MKKAILLMSIVLAAYSLQAQEVIQLYDGPAPGSEDWDWEETTPYGLVMNVTRPTLTVYRPENPNGVAMVVCPGGGFIYLAYPNEGEGIAKTLCDMGVTCFVLKYRLRKEEDPRVIIQYLKDGRLDEISKDVIPLALDDAANAIRYVRSHASEYGIDPDKIGITGSSAGGCVTMGTSMAATDDDCRPNFAVACYPYLSPFIGREAPNKPLPLFIATASDDTWISVDNSLESYRIWQEKGQKVEMHLYQKGEHGFVGVLQGLAVDAWTDNLFLWFKDIYPENFKSEE